MTTQSFAPERGASGDTPSTWPGADRRVRTGDRRQQNDSDRRKASRAARSLGRNSGGSSIEADYLRCLDEAKQCTERELQVVRLVLKGLTNKRIAQALDIREDTVKKHLQHVYTKLGIHRRELIILARTAV